MTQQELQFRIGEVVQFNRDKFENVVAVNFSFFLFTSCGIVFFDDAIV